MADDDKRSHAADRSNRLALQALNGKLDTIAERVGPLEDAVGNIVDTIDELAARQKQAKPAPAWWPALGAEHDERWGQFVAWLRDVLAARYPHDARHLTKCWKQHPPVVDALTALWLTWQAAYLNPSADSRDAAQWQSAWRMQLIGLVRDDEDLRECRGAGEHQAPPDLPAALLTALSG